MAGMSEDHNRTQLVSLPGAPPPRTVGGNQRRRSLPSPAEQKRRQEWGAKWGKLVGNAIREAMKGAG